MTTSTECAPTGLTAKFLNIEIDPDVTISHEGMNGRIGDAEIGAVEIVTGITLGWDGFGATAFAFDEGPGFDRTNEGTG
jgi:hypothetical protein